MANLRSKSNAVILDEGRRVARIQEHTMPNKIVNPSHPLGGTNVGVSSGKN